MGPKVNDMETNKTITITDTEGIKFDFNVTVYKLEPKYIHISVYANPQEKCECELFDIDWDKDNGMRFNCPYGINIQLRLINLAVEFLKDAELEF